MNNQQANPHLYDAIKERGMIYRAIYRELSDRYGQDEAVSVLRAAIYEHGKTFGKSLQCFAPRDFAGLVDGFANAPDGGATFSPKVNELSDTQLDVHMMTSPLKDAWHEAGCSDDEICTLLYCASAIDEGTLDAAGFEHEIELWRPGKTGCCRLRIREKS